MKTLPVGLAAHIAGGTTTLADLLKITRTDGTVFAFTSAADDVTISSVLYKSAQGLNISSLEASAGLNVDNLELSTLDDGTVFTKLDVLSGRWRNADFVISRYNWANPADGVDVRMVGTIGEVRLHRGYVTAELRGLQQYLQQPIGSVSSKTCRARLGDAMCTKNLTTFTYLAEVSAVTSNQVFSVIDPSGGTTDPNWSNVVLAMHLDGANGSTTFTDMTGKTVTPLGNAEISTAQYKFGFSSALLDGTGDYLSVPSSADFDFGSGNFTIEMWVHPTTIVGNHHIIGKYQSSATCAFVIFQSGAQIGFYSSSDGITWNLLSNLSFGSGFAANTWYHLAVTRSGNDWRTFTDGVLISSATVAGTVINNSENVQIGRGATAFPTEFAGYIDDLRITKGVARYTATFTPDTAQFLDNIPVGGSLPTTTNWFDDGLATWTSGANDGLTVKVKSSTAANVLTLSLPMLATVTAGDTLTLVAGCQKRLIDCSTKFSNVLNFQGEPHLPGIDEVVQ